MEASGSSPLKGTLKGALIDPLKEALEFMISSHFKILTPDKSPAKPQLCKTYGPLRPDFVRKYISPSTKHETLHPKLETLKGLDPEP